jgi:hypothetical protein
MRLALLALLGLLALAPIAAADDSSSGVMLPGLRSEPVGSITEASASVVVREGSITLSAVLDTHGATAPRAIISGPRFGWLGESEPYPDRQFPELSVSLDGQPISAESAFAAFAGSTEISEVIRAARIDPFAIADTPPFVVPDKAEDPAFQRLLKLGAIERSGGDYLARWTAQRSIKIALHPGARQTLSVIYKARPGYALVSFAALSAAKALAPFCLTAEGLRRLLGKLPADTTFPVRRLAIDTGIDNARPPELAVSIGSLADPSYSVMLAALCGADGNALTDHDGMINGKARAEAEGVLHILFIGSH